MSCSPDLQKRGKPTDERVADTFLAIKPLLPIPAAIILPLQFAIKSTAFTNFY